MSDSQVLELLKLSEEDDMTGLYNRRGGVLKIDKYIEENPYTQCAFIIFDGDYFKKINDCFGHQYGDRVIISCANEIKRRFSDRGIVLRLGGDEFVVFYTDTKIGEVQGKLDDFLTVCKKANIMDDHKTQFTFSIGVSFYPENGTDFDSLLRFADEALYKAKYDGRGCFRFYKDDLNIGNREQFMFDVNEFSRSLPGAFFVYEAGGDEKLLFIGDSLVNMFGCSTREEFRSYVGNSFRGIVHPDDFDEVEQKIHRQQFEMEDNENKMDYVRYRIICKDGSIKTVDDFGHLVYDVNFGMVYYVFLLDLDEHVFRGRSV